jgi:hypothetical protein
MNRYLCITCEVLGAWYIGAATSSSIGCGAVEAACIPNPKSTRLRVIDEAENQGYQGIILVYGLCGQATTGLEARSIPLIIPRAHDCITLFLGSRARYQEQFENYPGTFWYSQDYIERDDGSGTTLSLGSGTDTDLQAVYEEYVEKFGKENADYLMEVMGACSSTTRAVAIDLGIVTARTSKKPKIRRQLSLNAWW